MNSINMKELVDKVSDEMSKNDYRVYDSDIVRALNRATFEYNIVDGIHNIVIDYKDLTRDYI